MVAFKGSNRKNKFFIHFDRPCAGVTTEKVDLRDPNLRIMFQRVKYCTCSRCATTAEGHRSLLLLIDTVSGGLLCDVSDVEPSAQVTATTDAGVPLAVAHRPRRMTAWQGPPPGEAH